MSDCVTVVDESCDEYLVTITCDVYTIDIADGVSEVTPPEPGIYSLDFSQAVNSQYIFTLPVF